MNTKYLIIQTGYARPQMIENNMNFDQLIITSTGLTAEDFIVTDVFKDEALPMDLTSVKGVFLTGSRDMVTDELPWMKKTAEWLRNARKAGIPMLGICFGHQLLAYAFGGVVANHEKGTEVGTTLVNIGDKGIEDPLFRGLGQSFLAYVAHTQTVKTLPPTAECLASNDFEPHHCFKLSPDVYGVQFHPEFNQSIITDSMQYANKPEELRTVDKAMRMAATTDESAGEKLIKNFIAICE